MPALGIDGEPPLIRFDPIQEGTLPVVPLEAGRGLGSRTEALPKCLTGSSGISWATTPCSSGRLPWIEIDDLGNFGSGQYEILPRIRAATP